MLLALVVVPLAFAALAAALPSARLRPAAVTAGGAAHLALYALALRQPAVPAPGAWLALDPVARLVLGLVSVLFLACGAYAAGYLRHHAHRSTRVFCACLLAFLAGASLMAVSQHLGLMWVALEASTLAAAALLYFRRTPRSLEATWKFLLVGSVGVALGLLGTLFLGYAGLVRGGASLLLEDLVAQAPSLSRPWLRAAFVLLFVGYGTKMGVAPMHTWKPDAYGEAPGLAATLLAGSTTSCAFLAILRFERILSAAGEADFARGILRAFGLLSMAVAAVFLARPRDFKRALAYSSVEHVGILLLGAGVGAQGVYGALLHMVNNGLAKGVLFLAAGNLHRACGSKVTDEVRGALRALPLSGGLFLAGFFAATGSPPFGTFLSELTILDAAFGARRYVLGGLLLLLLAVAFRGLGSTVLAVTQGEAPPERAPETRREGALTTVPPLALLGVVLLLGVWLPRPLDAALRAAAAWLEPGR